MAAMALPDLLSDEARDICDVIFTVAVHGFLGVFGTVTNVINIMVFINQGLNETVTISFLALSLADLGNVLPLVWSSVCSNPWFQLRRQTENTLFVHLTSGAPHAMFLRCSLWIRVYINIERCLCIIFPLQVKLLVTKRTTVLVLLLIYMLMFTFLVQDAACHPLEPYFDTRKNLTVFGVTLTSSEACNINLSNLMNVSARVIIYLLDIILTLIMIQHLQVKSKWRSETFAGNTKHEATLRDDRLIKMLVFISFLYIFTSLPAICYTVCNVVLSSVFARYGVNRNFYSLVYSIAVSGEAIGSSFNIFIYYTMSAKFKMAFLQIFGRRK
ncbi:galanin-like G-protein coupled receptor npr-9 [Physella acuta]|uniref:galanin-like G-protein coupled receptor npr-9 n=1 Tax=Physella acuta TaxID=109671 RepID=UPI0027DD23CB|nr:galanin-like G-protein coupled receptor npr-9 [Physella acuta]